MRGCNQTFFMAGFMLAWGDYKLMFISGMLGPGCMVELEWEMSQLMMLHLPHKHLPCRPADEQLVFLVMNVKCPD